MRAGWVTILVIGGLLPLGCGGEKVEEKPRRQREPEPAVTATPEPTPDPSAEEAKPAEAAPEPTPEKPPEVALEVPEGVIVPGTEQTFDDTPAGRSMANLKKIALALRFHQAKQKTFPPPARYGGADDQPLLSWRVLLLPYLQQGKLFKEFKLDEPWDSPHNRALLAKMPDVYKTPGIDKEGYTGYVVPTGQGTVFAQRQGMAENLISDGSAKTALVVQVGEEKAVPWTKPEEWRYIPATPTAGLDKSQPFFLAAFGDAMVRKVPLSLDIDFIRGIFSANGHEMVNLAVLDQRPGEEGKPAAHTGLLGDAEAALARGATREALNLLLAEGIIKANPEVLKSLRWSAALKRPTIMLRVGLGIQLPGGVAAQGASSDMQMWGEKVGKPMVESLRTRMAKGKFGRWLQMSQDAPADGQPQPPPDPNLPAEQKIGQGGIAELGQGDVAALRRTAQKENIDVLVHVSITARAIKGRSGQETWQSSLSVKVLDAVKNETIWPSKTINSAPPPGTPLAKTAKPEEYGERAIRNLLGDFNAIVDAKLALTEMPQLTAEMARSRAEYLASMQHQNPLPALFELRYYEQQKLLTTDELAQFYGQILGEQTGPRLAKGSEQDRRQILAKWLKEAL